MRRSPFSDSLLVSSRELVYFQCFVDNYMNFFLLMFNWKKMKKNLQPTTPRVNLDDLLAVATRADGVLTGVRSSMLAPTAAKSPPLFSATQVGEICGLDAAGMQYRVRKGELPAASELEPGKKRKMFTLSDARSWARHFRKKTLRPEATGGIVIAAANFKGGVSKTTTAVTLAQGLSLRGHKVLVIDMDPQGSTSNLFGFLNADIDDDLTLLPLCYGTEVSVDYAVQRTYWDGIDIIPASLSLYSAEFALPSRQKDSADFEFWNVLKYGIDTAREVYDVIIIDTPPALSYLTINALLAADGLIMPIPPSTLDFTSSTQFWNLFNQLANSLIKMQGKTKEFDFVSVLLARVDSNDTSSTVVREWISAAYGEIVLPVEIPKTSVTSAASAEFGTVYDANVSEINARTYRRAFDAYERFVDLIEGQLQVAWTRQLNELAQGNDTVNVGGQ
jgi:chromosome partitioning protein